MLLETPTTTITPIYFKTNTGATVKAHVETSLINSKQNSESQPCIFLLENPESSNNDNSSIRTGEEVQQGGNGDLEDVVNSLKLKTEDNLVMTHHQGTKDVFLPQVVEENYYESGGSLAQPLLYNSFFKLNNKVISPCLTPLTYFSHR